MDRVITKTYRVLYLANPEVLNTYPDIYRQHTTERPDLLEYIEDESIVLVIDTETGEIYEDDEFFATAGHGVVVEFSTKELPGDDPSVQWK